jgi:glycerol-3-phosphate dehydrogenase
VNEERRRELGRLSRESFDLLVLGGGITGAGIARDAALRGLSVALVDKGDFAGGTSSKSSKLVHGGLRYLQQAQLGLVFEGTAERALLLTLAPHLVRPLEFLIPAYRRSYLAMVSIGLILYDLLALRRPPAGHRRFGPAELTALEPSLRRQDLRGGLTYFDCATDDARLTLENVLDARALGALCVSHLRAEAPLATRGRAGRITGVLARDAQTGETFPIRARVVLGALGPFTDPMLGEWSGQPRERLLRPTKGVHVIVPAERLPLRRAITLATRDRRVVFCIPNGRRVIVGTTDTDYPGACDEVAATLEDVVYLLGTASFYFPESKLRPEDVVSTYAGLRPLVAARGSASEVPREHEIFSLDSGMLIIAGGKLTTYRRMAQQAVDRVLERLADMGFGDAAQPCTTASRPLPGAFAAGEDMQGATGRIVRDHGLAEDIARHLAESYGARAERVLRAGSATRIDPELPYLWCEVDHALREELVLTVEDLLARRVPLLLFARDQGLGACEEVARRIAARDALPEPDRARQIERYRAVVARSRAFRS